MIVHAYNEGGQTKLFLNIDNMQYRIAFSNAAHILEVSRQLDRASAFLDEQAANLQGGTRKESKEEEELFNPSEGEDQQGS